MRVLIVNTAEMTGGAAIAANRLMKALNKSGVKARMLVAHKETGDLNVCPLPVAPWLRWLRFAFDRLFVLLFSSFSFSRLWKMDAAFLGADITKLREFQEADVVHLHWVSQGMLSLGDIQKILGSGKKIVWTLHDLWPITGICHHPATCERFATECNACPLTNRQDAFGLSGRVFRRKFNIYQSANIHLVAVSQWTAEQARKSALTKSFPVSVIGNVIDVTKFTPGDKSAARKELGIDCGETSGSKVVAFGAARLDDQIKGFSLFKQALQAFVQKNRSQAEQTTILLFGKFKDKSVLESFIPDVSPLKVKYLGYVNDTLNIYRAADVAVNSSYYETFGQTLAEAQAAGALPVSFDNSGQKDIINHKENGYLAKYLDTSDLAEGIAWALNADIPTKELHNAVAHRFSANTIAQKHISLYESL